LYGKTPLKTLWEKSEEKPICVWICHWKNSINPFGKIGENVDMPYMCSYSIKTPLKSSGENIRRK